MSKIKTFKMEREKSDIIHKVLGAIFILLALILIIPYIIHFIRITIAVLLIMLGIYFLTKETRFRWFKIRRF